MGRTPEHSAGHSGDGVAHERASTLSGEVSHHLSEIATPVRGEEVSLAWFSAAGGFPFCRRWIWFFHP